MKTIEERAKENNNGSLPNDFSYRDGYFDGATEQHKIDIDNACEWLKENLTLNGEDNETIIEFRKAMEE